MAEDGSLPKVSFSDYNTVQSLHKHLHPCYRLDLHKHHHYYNDMSVSDLMGNTK